MTLQEFCERIEAAEALEDLWSAAIDYFAEFGFDRVAYHHFPPAGADSDDRMKVFATGVPETFAEEYISGKLYLVDPIPSLAQTATEPFFWRDKLKLQKLAEPEQDFLNWLEKQGVKDGLTIQVFGPNGRNGLVAMGFGAERPELSLSTIRELQCACQIGHMIYIRLTSNSDKGEINLTSREKEVLGWVAQGKSNSVIADIMGISNHTVDAYLRRIYLKLGVSDRISASIRGLGAGLISGTV